MRCPLNVTQRLTSYYFQTLAVETGTGKKMIVEKKRDRMKEREIEIVRERERETWEKTLS